MFLCCAPGSKSLDYSNGMFDCQSPTSPFMGSLRALHLLEELRGVLEVMDTEERDSLRCQIPESTAESLGEWIHGHLVSVLHVKALLTVILLLSRFHTTRVEDGLLLLTEHILKYCAAVSVTASALRETC